MTWIIDESGRRWVEIPQKKPRKTPRSIKFADIKVGDQLMLAPKAGSYHRNEIYSVVTDIWFDPVAGQLDPIKGKMIGFAHINSDGSISARKSSTPVRGLASQGYEYAAIDYIALCHSRKAAMDEGAVVGIGFAQTIRARPKISGSGL